jgi:hypothetical protein
VSRKEIVLLVSRAIALLQIIAAVVDAVLNLPQQGYVLYRQYLLFAGMEEIHRFAPAPSVSPVFWIGVLTVFLRIGVLLFIAVLFWNCGPMVERWLMPTGVEQEQ